MAKKDELNYLTGPDLETRPEVAAVKFELNKIHIFLEGFGITITGVYTKPRPYGFDFDCVKAQDLLTLARSKASLCEDNTHTAEGRFSAGQTDGVGLRQIGSGPRLHLEIDINPATGVGKCNVHIDSHGYVMACGDYDYNRALEHGYWDLFSDKVPGFFGSFGKTGQVGPMVRPLVGVDGQTRWVIGLTGVW